MKNVAFYDINIYVRIFKYMQNLSFCTYLYKLVEEDFMDSNNSTFGKLTIIGMKGCEEITDKVDYYLKQFRKESLEASK